METVSFPRIRRSRFILVGEGDDAEESVLVPKVSASASAAESRRLVLRARFRPALSARGLKEISLSTRSSSSDSAAESRGGGVGDDDEASSNPSRRSTSYSAPRTPPFAEWWPPPPTA